PNTAAGALDGRLVRGRPVACSEDGEVDRVIRIGMLGCGTVGGGVARILHDEADDIAARTGAKLEITRIAVRDLGRDRGLPVPPDVYTDDARSVVEAEDVDVVVEV